MTSACTAGPEAYSMPAITHENAPLPAALNTLTATISASGATPWTPFPLTGAAMIPATCVPWLKPGGGLRFGSVGTNDLLSARLRFAAMSMWLVTMPLSRTATRARVALLPRSPFAAVASAWIARRFHCSALNVSAFAGGSENWSTSAATTVSFGSH